MMAAVTCRAISSASGAAAWMGLLVPLLAVAVDGCVSPTTGSAAAVRATEDRVTLSGRLHIIWNAEPHFLLVDDQGVTTRLAIDEALMKPFGGARRLNQTRVRIVGERFGDPPAVRVLSIEPSAESR
jgi:hypothetical protein